MNAGRKARRSQRPRQEVAVMNGEPNSIAGTLIEIGMRSKESIRLVGWRIAKTIDIVMAVAFRVGDADQRPKREILLHREPGLTGQVLARDEEFFALSAPFGCTGRVDHGLVDSLARLRGDPAIAERSRRDERVIGIVGLVDDEIVDRNSADWRGAGEITRHRLLDIKKPACDRGER